MENIFTTKPIIDGNYISSAIDDGTSKYKTTIVTKNCEISLNEQVIFVDTSVSDVIINIPNYEIDIDDGKFFYFKDVSNNAQKNNIIINGDGLNVDNKNSFTVNNNNGSIKIIYSKSHKCWFSL